MSDERDLADELYALWAKTTHADKGEWHVTGDDDHILVDVESVDTDEWEQSIANALYQKDADFIVMVHAALPALVRSLHSAWDMAERLDVSRDSRECRIAELELEVAELKADLEGLIVG